MPELPTADLAKLLGEILDQELPRYSEALRRLAAGDFRPSQRPGE
jgi:hypothetical protein